MKIIHLPAYAYPYFSGGKEVIVHKLSRELKRNGHEPEVWVNSIDIKQFEPTQLVKDSVVVKTLGELNGRLIFDLPKTIKEEFETELKNSNADIVHFHEHSKGASLAHLRIAKQLNKKVVYTYHTPGQSCPQGGLLKNNKTPCDGKVEINQCTTCRYYTAGIGFPFAELLSAISPKTKKANAQPRQLFYKAEVIEYKKYFDEFIALVDAIHIYAPWVGEMLQRNGVPEEKIHLVQLGNTYPTSFKEEAKNNKLKLAFLGRCEPVKGIEVLIDAAKKVGGNQIEVSFFSGPWERNQYGKKMLTKIEGDGRFNKPTMLSQEELPEKLSQFDAVVIPSLWLETGPLTVFDAFNAGVPVIASNLGGLADRVRHQVDGILFETGNASELSKVFSGFIEHKEGLKELRNNVKPLDTMEIMTAGIESLYKRVLNT